MIKFNLFKIIISLTLFFVVIKLADSQIHLDYFQPLTLIVLTLSLLFSIFFISVRTNIIFNKNNKKKFIQIYFFHLVTWSASNLFITSLVDFLKIFFFNKNLSKSEIISNIFFEKFIVFITLHFLLILYFIFFYIFNIQIIYLNYLIIIFIIFLSLIYLNLFKKINFYKFPYINFINFDLFNIIKSYSIINLTELFLANFLIHLTSFLNFLIILTILNINFNFYYLILMYFVYYLSSFFSYFLSGIGIREVLFISLSSIIPLTNNILLNLAILFSSFNILASLLIYFFFYFYLLKKKKFNLT